MGKFQPGHFIIWPSQSGSGWVLKALILSFPLWVTPLPFPSLALQVQDFLDGKCWNEEQLDRVWLGTKINLWISKHSNIPPSQLAWFSLWFNTSVSVWDIATNSSICQARGIKKKIKIAIPSASVLPSAKRQSHPISEVWCGIYHVYLGWKHLRLRMVMGSMGWASEGAPNTAETWNNRPWE